MGCGCQDNTKAKKNLPRSSARVVLKSKPSNTGIGSRGGGRRREQQVCVTAGSAALCIA